MASGPQTFVIVGVFSAESFQGNRLAIVAVRGNAFNREQKALIAREFGFTGTVFIHDAISNNQPRKIEIFSEKGEELPFSGHCVLGTAHYVFRYCEPLIADNGDKSLTTILMTKAGPSPVLYNPQRQIAACSVPQDYHLHKKRVPFDKVQVAQPQIQIVPTIEKCKGKSFPVVSIVKGMTFALIDLTDAPEVLGALSANQAPEIELDEGWDSTYVGALYYKKNKSLEQAGEPVIHSIQVRVITEGTEDPGTGSACSALVCYLALNQHSSLSGNEDPSRSTEEAAKSKPAQHLKPEEGSKQTVHHIYAIQQGTEMKRKCTIALEVDVDVSAEGTRTIKNVTLSGRASFFARGELNRL